MVEEKLRKKVLGSAAAAKKRRRGEGDGLEEDEDDASKDQQRGPVRVSKDGSRAPSTTDSQPSGKQAKKAKRKRGLTLFDPESIQ